MINAASIYSFLLVVFFGLCGTSPLASAHSESHQTAQQGLPPEKIAEIRAAYLSQVKPIFRQKCFDCHSAETRYPWYYNIPGARQLIDHDIRDARKHIDMNIDFPFGGSHHNPAEALKVISDEVSEDGMPPWTYRIMHSGAALTKEERAIVLDWIRKAQ